jgi:hypothetical protein
MTSALRKRPVDPDPDKGGCVAKDCKASGPHDCQTTICKEKKDDEYKKKENKEIKKTGKPPARDCFKIDPDYDKCYNLESDDGRKFVRAKGSNLECKCTVYERKECNPFSWAPWNWWSNEKATYAQRELLFEFRPMSIQCGMDRADDFSGIVSREFFFFFFCFGALHYRIHQSV